MSALQIDQAFIKAILNGGLGLDIVHENGLYSTWNGSVYVHATGVYTPTAGRGFIEVKSFPAGTRAQSLADSDEHVGLFQCIVKYPADVAAMTIKTKAESLLGLFKIGAAIMYNLQKVFIVSKYRDGGRNEGSFYQIVCRINYQAFVAR